MAIMIPNRITSDMRATPGEVKTFETLAKHLDDDWYVWYDIGIGNTEIYPDFILIHPLYGLYVLEVKDFYLKHIIDISKDKFVTNSRKIQNPMHQARNYTMSIINKVKADIPYVYCAVFPNISKDELNTTINSKTSISKIINPKLIITKEQLDSKVAEKLLSMRSDQISNKKVTLSSFNQLRMVIDPSIKVPHRFVTDSNDSKNKMPAVLDIKQERAAKSIGEGHRLLKGIAGSGKTLIMLYRAKLIARLNPDWEVLFICWNRSLINYLEQMYNDIDLNTTSRNIEFTYFTRWATQIGKIYNINFPKDVESPNYNKKYNDTISRLLDQIPIKKYDAILIDEAQDFEDDYFRLLVNHLNSETDSLLICYDYAQNIYQRKSSWKKLGINVAGKRSINLSASNDNLSKNYRNTREITKFAKLIYNDKIPTKDENDTIYDITKIQGNASKGPQPIVEFCYDRQQEYEMVTEWIKNLIESESLQYSDILIIYPAKRLNDFDLEYEFIPYLHSQNIPYNWITKDRFSKSSFHLDENTVKISTIQSAKGMDFEAVAVVACDNIKDEQVETQLYISVTRARKYLLLTTGRPRHQIEKILKYSIVSLGNNRD